MGKSELTPPRIGTIEGREPKTRPLGDKQRSYKALFDSFTHDSQGKISPFEVLTRLRTAGIRPDDPRIQETWKALDKPSQESGQLDFERFIAICQRNSGIITRAIRGELVIPDFPAFIQDIEAIYRNWSGY